MTLSEVTQVSGSEGNFTVSVKEHPRYVDMSKCIACGECAAKCPKKVDDDYNASTKQRKAIFVKYSQAVPLKYQIDADQWKSPQTFEHKRRKDFTSGGRKGVDPQRAGRGILLGTHGIERMVNIRKRGRDLFDKPASRFRQSNAAGGAVEQAHPPLAFQPGNDVAERAGRQAEIERRRAKRSLPRNRDHRIELGKAVTAHYPVFCNNTSLFILLIR